MVPSIVQFLLAFTLSSQGGGASAMLVFDVQMLWIRMMMWTDRTHVLAAQVQETTIRVSCDTCHKQLRYVRLARMHQ